MSNVLFPCFWRSFTSLYSGYLPEVALDFSASIGVGDVEGLRLATLASNATIGYRPSATD